MLRQLLVMMVEMQDRIQGALFVYSAFPALLLYSPPNEVKKMHVYFHER